MNSQTKANSTIDLISSLLENLVVNKYTDKLFVYVIIPMASLGTLFNLISLVIFFKKSFKDVPLFKYMRVYTLASLIVALSLIFSFHFSPYTFPELLFAYSTRIFNCKIVPSYVTAFFFFYGNVLDIFINIERALCFSNGFKRFKKISPYVICLILLFLCVLINGPSYFLYDIVPDSELETVMRICSLSEFTTSDLGELLLIISYVIQGPVILIILIVTNIIAVISYRRYLKRKEEAHHRNSPRRSGVESGIQKKKKKKMKI